MASYVVAVAVVVFGVVAAGAADHDLVGVDPDRHLALPRPVLDVDGIVLDRSVEPEPVAVGLSVVEGPLELFAPATSAAPSAATPPARAGLTLTALGLLAVLVLALLLGGGLLGLLDLRLDGRGLDLRLDLVAEIDLAAAGVLVVGVQVVLFAEITQLGRA